MPDSQRIDAVIDAIDALEREGEPWFAKYERLDFAQETPLTPPAEFRGEIMPRYGPRTMPETPAVLGLALDLVRSLASWCWSAIRR